MKQEFIIAIFLILSGSLLLAGETAAEQRLINSTIASRFLGTPRTVRIYLPASYQSSPERRYPVLYLHHGQNVFSFAGTNIAFGWGSWELDKTVDALSHDGKIPELIMVGIDNA